MSMSVGGTVVLVLLILLVVIVALVLVFMKCRNQSSSKYTPWRPSKEKEADFKKLDVRSGRTPSSSSRSPLFDRRQTPTHLVIPFSSSNPTPNVTTIHIPVTGSRRLTDTDSSQSSSASEEEDEGKERGGEAVAPVANNLHDEVFVDDNRRDSRTARRVSGGNSSDDDQAERAREGDEEDSASWTMSPAHSAPEVSVSAPETGESPRNKSTLESDYEETAYSVYRQEKEVLQSPSTPLPHSQDHTTVVESHLFPPPVEKKKKKRKRKGLSVPHMAYRHQSRGERRASSQLLYDSLVSLDKGRAGSADNIQNLVEPIGKLFIRIQHKASEEKLMLLINKVTDLDLPERLKLKKSLNPVLYIRGGFLPSMGQRFITKFAAFAQDATWCSEFAILGVSKSAAWQLTLRLYLCFRENSIKRAQIIGVCDVVLGQINLERSQEVILNFFSSERQYSELGDLHLSVCYQPDLQRMVFLVLEARDLPRSALFGSIHSVAKIEMLCEGKRVEKQKSRVVREAHNPVWNDQMAFAIPERNARLQDIQFDLTVLHVDMVKGSHTVGKCGLGWSATCEELEHWNEVMQNPNRPLPMWLSLQYPD